MARPIRSPPEPAPPEGPLEELRPDLVESVESLRALLELVRRLDERGVLRFSAGLLGEEDRVVEVLTERLPAADVRKAVRNLELLVRAFRDLDPTTLAPLAGAVPGALDAARAAQEDRPLGWLDVVSALRDPEVNRGLRMVLGFLRGMGRSTSGAP